LTAARLIAGPQNNCESLFVTDRIIGAKEVVDLAYEQKPTASTEEVGRCLSHYADYDDFLDLAP
jgi:hypothetical protein